MRVLLYILNLIIFVASLLTLINDRRYPLISYELMLIVFLIFSIINIYYMALKDEVINYIKISMKIKYLEKEKILKGIEEDLKDNK